MFIITLLDVSKNIVSLLTKQKFESEQEALNEVFKYINSQDEKAYINKIRAKQYIEVYKIQKGILYNSKTLDHVFQVLEIQ